jgi:hypothetical protein
VKIYAVGGSTMLGRGCPEASSYLSILKNQYGIHSKMFAEDLIGIRYAIDVLSEIPKNSTLVLQIGAGDQIRMISNKISRWLPGSLGTSKTALDQPLYKSKRRIRRFYNEAKSFLKYLLKSFLLKTAIYRQEISLQEYQQYLRTLASLAEKKGMRVIWVSTVKGFYRVPDFLKVEKEHYSGVEAFKVIKSQIRSDSRFLDLEAFILDSDTIVDGFHLNQKGHSKLAEELYKVLL